MSEFCQHFVSGSSPGILLDAVFTTQTPRIHEHGPEWARQKLPFLHKQWLGRGDGSDTTDQYFNMLGQTLRFFPAEDTIPAAKSFVVDPFNESGMIRAKCKLQSVATDVSWEEIFVFSFAEFDDKGKIALLEIWSDGLSAWNAVTNGKTQAL